MSAAPDITAQRPDTPVSKRVEFDVQCKQSEDLGQRTIRFIASTGREDRDGDTIDPAGIQTDEFARNPVFLQFHDYNRLPAGRAVNWGVGQIDGQDAFYIDIHFPSAADLGYSDEGVMPEQAKVAMAIYRWYKHKLLNSVSIGFAPIAEGVERRQGGGFHFSNIELLEVSAVPVPSNRDAHALMREMPQGDAGLLKGWAKSVLDVDEDSDTPMSLEGFDEIAGKMITESLKDAGFRPTDLDSVSFDSTEKEVIQSSTLSDGQGEKAGQTLNRANRERTKQIIRIAAEMMASQGMDAQQVLAEMAEEEDKGVKGAGELTFRGPTTFQDLPLASRETVWDSDAATDRLRELTGSEDEPATGYKRFFMWYDEGEADNFGGYKLPYADVVDGEARAVPNAIFAIASVLQGGRGGVDVPDDDMPALRGHVAQYYDKMRETFDDFDGVPPWEETESRDYSEKADKMITEDNLSELMGMAVDLQSSAATMLQILHSDDPAAASEEFGGVLSEIEDRAATMQDVFGMDDEAEETEGKEDDGMDDPEADGMHEDEDEDKSTQSDKSPSVEDGTDVDWDDVEIALTED